MESRFASSLARWGTFGVIKPLPGGSRNVAFLVEQSGERYVAKSTRRSEAALAWLEAVHQAAAKAGFMVPELVKNLEGRWTSDGLTLERFLEGQPIAPEQMPQLLPNLRQFHQLTQNFSQRPGFASALDLLTHSHGADIDLSRMPPELVVRCREAWQILQGKQKSVVHSDLNPNNILITPSGQFALLDWDEARVDASLFDSLNVDTSICTEATQRVLDAWEVAVCWWVEPEYARALAERTGLL